MARSAGHHCFTCSEWFNGDVLMPVDSRQQRRQHDDNDDDEDNMDPSTAAYKTANNDLTLRPCARAPKNPSHSRHADLQRPQQHRHSYKNSDAFRRATGKERTPSALVCRASPHLLSVLNSVHLPHFLTRHTTRAHTGTSPPWPCRPSCRCWWIRSCRSWTPPTSAEALGRSASLPWVSKP